jgi:hypothetical protein
LPVAVSIARERPWNEWSVVMTSYAPFRLCWPYLRASFTAPSFASTPLFEKKTRSKTEFWISRSASSSWGTV